MADKKLTRRQFVEKGLKATVAVGAGMFVGRGLVAQAPWVADRKPPGEPLQRLGQGTPVRVGNGSRKLLTFAHITDPHLYVIDETDENFAAFEKYMKSRMEWRTEKPYGQVTAELAKRNVRLAIMTGDIVDYVTDDNLRMFSTLFFSSPTQMHYCLGNHDYATLTVDKDAHARWERGASEELLNRWNSTAGPFGPGYYSVQHAAHEIILLDNGPGDFDDKQLEWLDGYLAGIARKTAVLAFHIPLFTDELAKELKGRTQGMLVPKKSKIFDLLPEHKNIAAMLTGHLHRNYETKVGRIPQYVTSAMFHSGFRMVECYV